MKNISIKGIWDSISETILVGLGGTGYLDRPVKPEASVSKGVDVHGRHYLTLCVRTQKNDEPWRLGVVTVFQRFSNDENVVVMAQNVGYARLFDSAATTEDMHSLETLVRNGQAVFQSKRFDGSIQETRVELTTPDAAVSEPRLNKGVHYCGPWCPMTEAQA